MKSAVSETIDVFICCGSFEDRCLSVANNIKELVKRALIVENKDEKQFIHVDKNTQNLRKIFSGYDSIISFNSSNPIKTADSMKLSLEEVSKEIPLKYLVDITTFTHESLLILLKLLKLHLKPKDSIKFVYTNAKDYSVGLRHEEKWLSKGSGEVRSVLGYPGEVLPTRKTHLIVLVGFEHERASKLIEAFEPNMVSLAYGKSETKTDIKHESANKYFYQLLHKTVSAYTVVKDFEFSCNDPWNTRDSILTHIESTEEFNRIIAPMNTKISTIGSALAAFANESIQLCYAQAHNYNYRNYSSAGDKCYLFELPELFNYTD